MKIVILFITFLFVSSSAYENKSIVQWLIDNGYSTLVSLVQDAGLANTLSTGGPFTVFAPTNAAFAKIPASELAALRSDPTALQNILKGHVVTGYVLGPQIGNGQTSMALNSDVLTYASTPSSGHTVNGARIVSSDNILNNGVVHGIDSVILPAPPVTETIPEILLKQDGRFSDLDLLLAITGLNQALRGSNLTLFAPTDTAFNAISGSLPSFSNPNALAQYTEILKAHVVAGVKMSTDLRNGDSLPTLHGTNLAVTIGAGVKVNNANVIEADIKAVNGVIHVIDTVIVPSDL